VLTNCCQFRKPQKEVQREISRSVANALSRELQSTALQGWITSSGAECPTFAAFISHILPGFKGTY
jgi:hypothetical protein